MRGKWWIVFAFAAGVAVTPRSNEVSYAGPSAMSLSEPQTRSRGADLDCRDFRSHDAAQAFYEANDPGDDPHRLDGDGDGIACERLR